jgi:hypothetical protein
MTSQPRPKVDFSHVSLGSLKRYQAVYGLIDSDEALAQLVTDHFGGCCYSIMPPSKDIGEKYVPRTLGQVAENAPCKETRSADDAVDYFLKVRKDDKLEEQGIRKSARNRDKQEKKSA